MQKLLKKFTYNKFFITTAKYFASCKNISENRLQILGGQYVGWQVAGNDIVIAQMIGNGKLFDFEFLDPPIPPRHVSYW